MKTNLINSRRHSVGFTLVELLVVIAIIGILAGMLLPVLNRVSVSAKKTKAKIEEQDIVTAIQGYDSAYGRFPVSSAVQNSASTTNGDFTYGGTGCDAAGKVTWTLGTMTNSEVIAILMDNTNWANGVNFNHLKNPQQTIFLNAKMSDYPRISSTPPPAGVDQNGTYRDPWGNPYIITMDLNYNELCEDAFYGQASVSKDSNGNPINGLVLQPDGNYAARMKVMVWSAGPDGKFDPNLPATGPDSGVNKDNVLSWQ